MYRRIWNLPHPNLHHVPSPEVSGDVERSVPVRMLLPHEILAAIYGADCALVFDSIMLGNLSEKARVDFWNHLKTLRGWSSHPVLNDERYIPQKLVGFTFHADGAQMYRDDEFFVWSLSSIFAANGLIQDVLAFQFPFAIIPERFMRSKNATCKRISNLFFSDYWFKVI